VSVPEDGSVESFRGQILQLRGRLGLTQRELAARIDVHAHSVQAWEAGLSYPGAASLRALIELAAQSQAFTAGQEAAEAAALWAAALERSSRLRTPFDRAWFDGLLSRPDPPAERGLATEATPAAQVSRPAPPIRRQSWGDAPDVAAFVGRSEERERIYRWVLEDRCRLIGLVGLGGIGKTLLAARLAQDLAPHFDYVYWRSLRDAPAPGEWLAGALAFLAPDEALPTGEAARAVRLLELLSQARCLLVLDNFETVLPARAPGTALARGGDGYGPLLRQLGEVLHQSCLLLTSREAAPELELLRGELSPVRTLDLTGLSVADGQSLLSDKRLVGDDDHWRALVTGCGGNGLALKVTGETIRDLFDGSIAAYLEYLASSPNLVVGGLRQLLEGQIQRLSRPERDLLRWLAVEREPVSFNQLAGVFGARSGRAAALGAVEGLRRRSMLERAERRSGFTLHSVVLEYVTEQLVDDVVEELRDGELEQLLTQPLVKATAPDYARRGQERLIAAPVLARLAATSGGQRRVEARLLALLDQLRGQPPEEQGYGPGNLVNLLRLSRGDLAGVDLAGLFIRQAYLQEVEAPAASLAGAHLSEAVLAQAFDYPTHLALSADGNQLAAGTATGEVCLWRIADRTLLATSREHQGLILGVALTGDGRLLATSSYDGTVKLWAGEEGRLLQSLQGHPSGTLGLALSADGQAVASGSFDGTVRVWEAASGRLLATIAAHASAVWALALSADGRLLASGGQDGTLHLWATETGQRLAALEGHSRGILGLALSRDGQLLASGGEDATVRLWATAGGRLLTNLSGHLGPVWDVALSGDGQLLASASEDRAVRLWETETGRLLTALDGHVGGVRAVALSDNGQLVASGSVDGTIRLWETESGWLLATLQGRTGGVRAVALSDEPRRVVSGSVDATVRLWDTLTDRPLATLSGHAAAVWDVALSAAAQLAASGSHDGTICLWDPASGRLLTTLRGHTAGVRAVALSADGRLVASGGVDGTVRLWEVVNGRLLATLTGHGAEVHGVALSGDGNLVASGGVDGTVRLWQTDGGRLLGSWPAHGGAVWDVSLSWDGTLLASAGQDRAIRLWATADAQPLATLTGHAGSIWAVALSADGRLLASASEDRTVKLWSAQTGQQLASLEAHTGGVLGVALSPDGQLVASGSLDGTIRLWEAPTGTCLRILSAARRYERLDITGLTGITAAQREALLNLGAVDRASAVERR
jgi:WD40 repeat protein/transcriptional regulator with XRE-family HTH domain